MLCAISYNLKNMKNIHRGVLLLVKLQGSGCKWYQVALNVSYTGFIEATFKVNRRKPIANKLLLQLG